MKVLLFLLTFLFSTYVHSSVKVALFDIAPFSYINDKGELDGVVYKLCKKIEKESGLEFDYSLVPYARAIKLLTDGEVDLAVFYPSTKYEGLFDKLAPTLGNYNYLVSLKNLYIKSLNDIGEKKIGLIRGAKYSEEFDKMKKPGVVFLQDYSKVFNMLLLNRIDIAVISSAAFEYFLRVQNINAEDKLNIYTINLQPNWIHINKKLDPNIREKLKKANSSVIRSGGYKTLEELL
ncbi:substrate-binding periplasmic protein [Halobacteriovorax sp.]|uniref:substrate-binding periplasmic protein n=1 Tax=Halobacteriovorax sp. TaxID=2020862 RepID=UPI0035629278